MSLLEVTMLMCFGVSWPLSIAKIVRSRAVAGKSPAFLSVILLGYAAGIAHKLIYARDWVLSLYVLNFCMVAFDMALYLHYSCETRHRKLVRVEPQPVGQFEDTMVEELTKSGIMQRQLNASGKWTVRHGSQGKQLDYGTRKPRKRRKFG